MEERLKKAKAFAETDNVVECVVLVQFSRLLAETM